MENINLKTMTYALYFFPVWYIFKTLHAFILSLFWSYILYASFATRIIQQNPDANMDSIERWHKN